MKTRLHTTLIVVILTIAACKKQQTHDAPSTPAEQVTASPPSFRGIYPGMTFQQIVQVTKKEPLMFDSEPDRDDIANGVIVLQVDYKRLEGDKTKLEEYYRVAVGADGTTYEWQDIIVKMYKNVAVCVQFLLAKNSSFLRSDILPWTAAMVPVLIDKYGKPDGPVFNLSTFNVNTVSEDKEQPVAKWTRGDYEIYLAIGRSGPNYHAFVTYTSLPLLHKMEADKSVIKSNL